MHALARVIFYVRYVHTFDRALISLKCLFWPDLGRIEAFPVGHLGNIKGYPLSSMYIHEFLHDDLTWVALGVQCPPNGQQVPPMYPGAAATSCSHVSDDDACVRSLPVQLSWSQVED